ncbi:MAG: heparinase II/III family protein [Clostridiales bacterium]|nr:heparinase II/III family protein [Clostridiales bacterium]
MKHLLNWNIITKKIQNEIWAEKLYNQTMLDLDWFIDNYHDDASRVTGWFHHYNCEKCQGRLIFNIEDENIHVCSICGHKNSSQTLSNVWYNAYRGKANSSVYNAAVAFNITSDPKYITHMKDVLNFYAKNYDDLLSDPIAKRFEGKIQNQHLDDAVSMMIIILGLSMVKDQFSEKELSYYYENLFSKEADMFDFFASRIYNIPVWIKSAQTLIGVFFNEETHIKKGFYGQFGILDQLKRGVTEEGMWYEGSMHYHFYTIQPLAYLLYLCKVVDFKIPEMQYIYDTVEKMYEYPLKMMFSNRQLPNPNDAHPKVTIDMYKAHYEYASIIYDNKLFKKICASFYQDDSSVGSFTRLLFNHESNREPLPSFGTVNNEKSCTAMLRNETTELFFKYGALTHLHRHPDTMNFELAFDGDVVSYDIGNGGYASSLFVEWQRKTLCHNTVTVDQSDHFKMSLVQGDTLEFDKEHNHIRTKAKGIYQAVDFDRSFTLDKNKVYDDFLVHGWGEYSMDWFFYCKGEMLCEYDTISVDKIGEEDGYQHLFDIKQFNTDNDWFVTFKLEDKDIKVSMKGEKGTTVYLVNSYTANKEQKRYGIVVRRKASKTTYKTTYEYIKK